MDQGPREGTDRRGPPGPVRAATLSLGVRLWSEDGTASRLRGVDEPVRTGERCCYDTYGLLVDATNGSVRRGAAEKVERRN
jgi:hypothetical protein